MILYLDESYDQPNARFLLLGLLFSPSKQLHRSLTEIHEDERCQDKHGNVIETKYNNCYTEQNYGVCKKFIDAFFVSDSSFCSIAVDTITAGFDLSYFGKTNEPDAIKKARAYKKFTELLVKCNTKNLTNGVLLVDEVTRCNHDRFIELMRECFCSTGAGHSRDKEPILRHISSVASGSPENIRLSVCDILLGCILNNNLPTKNLWKNQIRIYLISKLGIRDLLKPTWITPGIDRSIRNKFQIWYWRPNIKKAQIPNHRQ